MNLLRNKNILDFNAIGKGYTVDQIDKYFKSIMKII